MSLDEGDKLTAIVPVPVEDNIEEQAEAIASALPTPPISAEIAPQEFTGGADAAELSDEEE